MYKGLGTIEDMFDKCLKNVKFYCQYQYFDKNNFQRNLTLNLYSIWRLKEGYDSSIQGNNEEIKEI
jgi:hypothetical protein